MHMIRSFLWHQDTCKELGRTKLNVQIRDDTGSVDATIFKEKAEALYDMTATELAQHTSTGNLPISLIEKLSAPKKHNISLKASMYDYGGINRCVFNIDSVSEPINAEELLQIEPSQEQQSQPQPPKTPSKCAQGEGSKVSSTTYCTEMEDDEFEPATETQAEKRVIPMSNASKLSWENRHSANLLCE